MLKPPKSGAALRASMNHLLLSCLWYLICYYPDSCDWLFSESRCKDRQCSSNKWSVEILLNSTDHYLSSVCRRALCLHRCCLEYLYAKTLFNLRDCLEREVDLAGKDLAHILRTDSQFLGNIVTGKPIVLHIVHDGIGYTTGSSQPWGILLPPLGIVNERGTLTWLVRLQNCTAFEFIYAAKLNIFYPLAELNFK